MPTATAWGRCEERICACPGAGLHEPAGPKRSAASTRGRCHRLPIGSQSRREGGGYIQTGLEGERPASSGIQRALETIGIHLKIALGLSNEVGPPQKTRRSCSNCSGVRAFLFGHMSASTSSRITLSNSFAFARNAVIRWRDRRKRSSTLSSAYWTIGNRLRNLHRVLGHGEGHLAMGAECGSPAPGRHVPRGRTAVRERGSGVPDGRQAESRPTLHDE